MCRKLFITYRKHQKKKQKKKREKEEKKKKRKKEKRKKKINKSWSSPPKAGSMKKVGHLVAGVETVTFS